jgi:hypothetical protein
MLTYPMASDRDARLDLTPNVWQIQRHIHQLVEQYLSFEILRDRLEDLPPQFKQPQPRPWQPIAWQAIEPSQVIGLDLELFLAIIVGALNTEAPIRGYTQTSRQYLATMHPPMARFVGGIVADNGKLLEPGLWEKEERQHAPALLKIYQQLTGNQFTPHPPTVRLYQPSDNPYNDLYRHGLHRTLTEYGAVCLYLWLMAHTTGSLQQVFAELVQDEINHMTKFWGFGVWLFPDASPMLIKHLCKQLPQSQAQSSQSIPRTFRRMMEVLNWETWTWVNQGELAYTFVRVMIRLLCWHKTLSREYLQQLFTSSP